MKIGKCILNGLVISTLVLSLQGCIVAGVGAGIACVKYGNAKKNEAKTKEMHAYNEYVLGMQKVNIERQKSHLRPEPIMTYENYLGSKKK